MRAHTFHHERIRELMARRRWHGADLADRSGVSPSTISRVFAGKQEDFTIPQLYAIADALDVEPGDLLPRSEPVADEHRELLRRLDEMPASELRRLYDFVGFLAQNFGNTSAAEGRESPRAVTPLEKPPTSDELPIGSGLLVDLPRPSEPIDDAAESPGLRDVQSVEKPARRKGKR